MTIFTACPDEFYISESERQDIENIRNEIEELRSFPFDPSDDAVDLDGDTFVEIGVTTEDGREWNEMTESERREIFDSMRSESIESREESLRELEDELQRNRLEFERASAIDRILTPATEEVARLAEELGLHVIEFLNDNFSASRYVYVENDDEECLKIRLSDHPEKPGRGGFKGESIYGTEFHERAGISIVIEDRELDISNVVTALENFAR